MYTTLPGWLYHPCQNWCQVGGVALSLLALGTDPTPLISGHRRIGMLLLRSHQRGGGERYGGYRYRDREGWTGYDIDLVIVYPLVQCGFCKSSISSCGKGGGGFGLDRRLRRRQNFLYISIWRGINHSLMQRRRRGRRREEREGSLFGTKAKEWDSPRYICAPNLPDSTGEQNTHSCFHSSFKTVTLFSLIQR